MHSVHIAQLYNHKHTCNLQGCLETIPPNAQLLFLQSTSHRPPGLPDVLSFHRIWQPSSRPAAASSAAQSSCNITGETQEVIPAYMIICATPEPPSVLLPWNACPLKPASA
jgi:hypothetical protein